MPKAGEKALGGQWEDIVALRFEITERMIMTFEGSSCNIQDSRRNLVKSLGAKDGQVTQEVEAGYRCYVIRSRVKFEKRS